jgi:hypothetical protein
MLRNRAQKTNHDSSRKEKLQAKARKNQPLESCVAVPCSLCKYLIKTTVEQLGTQHKYFDKVL